MALFQRERVKVPLSQRVIDVALNESVLSVMESLVPDYLAYGVTRERVGGRMEGIAPSNAYPCADGTSIIVAGTGTRSSSATCRPSADPTSPRNRSCRPMRGDGNAARNSMPRSRNGQSYTAETSAQTARRGRRPVRADLHGCRHLLRRTVRGAKHDPAVRSRHRRERAEIVGFPGIVPVIGGARFRSAASGPTSERTPERSSRRSWASAMTRSEH